MSGKAATKRRFLKLAIAAGGTMALSPVLLAAQAQAPRRRLLGVDIPQEILQILPQKPLNYLQMADAVISLESEAQQRALPPSPLSAKAGSKAADRPIRSIAAGEFYQFVMPRLVALIDRSETIDPAFADRAGSLLADLHQSQHEIPDLLRNPLNAAHMPAPARGSAGQGMQRKLPGPLADLGLPGFAIASLDATAGPPAAGDAPIISFPDGAPPPAAPVEVAPPAPGSDDDGPDDPQAAPPGPPPPLSRKKDFASLRDEYRRMFDTLSVRPAFAESAEWHLRMLRQSRARYERVQDAVEVPWHFIGVIHALESSFNFRAHLHNGDFPLTARTRQVPAGRPAQWLPPSDWESSARDALRLLGFTGLKDWSLERTIHRLEAYNGMGYRSLGVPSPYLWSFSNHYERGKYVADGRYNPRARSQQCGTIVMLKLLQEAGDIKLVPAAPDPAP